MDFRLPGNLVLFLNGPEIELIDVEFLKLGFTDVVVHARYGLLLKDTHAILVYLRFKSQVLLLLDLLALLMYPGWIIFLQRLLRQLLMLHRQCASERLVVAVRTVLQLRQR